MAKGLVAAVIVSQFAQLKRSDGKLAVPWYADKMKELLKTGGGLLNKKK